MSVSAGLLTADKGVSVSLACAAEKGNIYELGEEGRQSYPALFA